MNQKVCSLIQIPLEFKIQLIGPKSHSKQRWHYFMEASQLEEFLFILVIHKFKYLERTHQLSKDETKVIFLRVIFLRIIFFWSYKTFLPTTSTSIATTFINLLSHKTSFVITSTSRTFTCYILQMSVCIQVKQSNLYIKCLRSNRTSINQVLTPPTNFF